MSNPVSPTPEELRQYGFALSLKQEVDYWLENRHPAVGAALVAAAEALGLEPVTIVLDGVFTRDDFRKAEHEVLEMLYPSVVPTGDGSNWEEQCDKRRLFLAHADRIAEHLWSITGRQSALSSSPKETPTTMSNAITKDVAEVLESYDADKICAELEDFLKEDDSPEEKGASTPERKDEDHG